jgi:threonine/homoserine efflux transporter RhtA
VQAFFSFRIYGLSKKFYIPILTWGMALLRLLLSAVIFFKALRLTSVDISETKWQWLLTATWSISAANDLTVTIALVVLPLPPKPKCT